MTLKVVVVLIFISVLASTASAGDIDKGMDIYDMRGCSICHSIDREGGVVGPDLTQVTVRRGDERLFEWLKDPAAILPSTVMPKIAWSSEEEIRDLIAYFKSVAKPIDRSFVGKIDKVEAGRRLVEEFDCRSCHRIIDPASGRGRYPDLTSVATRRDAEWLVTWLKDPQQVKPGTFMPTYPLSKIEREAIVAFLLTLK